MQAKCDDRKSAAPSWREALLMCVGTVAFVEFGR